MNDKVSTELSDDMEVIGPGQMLREARECLSLSQKDVADKLNFRLNLVMNIEDENFDKSLPATYNRGYLCNYAKLVHISSEDILASYDMLGVAEVQSAEMQSFSRITEKQAQNSRLMWISYLIAALFVGSTVMWWLQDTNLKQKLSPENNVVETTDNSQKQTTEQENLLAEDTDIQISEPEGDKITTLEKSLLENTNSITAPDSQIEEDNQEINNNPSDNVSAENSSPERIVETAIFTFSGDCWVNIYDATGERIAWGIKKLGYVMTIEGIPPLSVTLGKPELASIVYSGEEVDMSQFNSGNIAKFTLPIVP